MENKKASQSNRFVLNDNETDFEKACKVETEGLGIYLENYVEPHLLKNNSSIKNVWFFSPPNHKTVGKYSILNNCPKQKLKTLLKDVYKDDFLCGEQISKREFLKHMQIYYGDLLIELDLKLFESKIKNKLIPTRNQPLIFIEAKFERKTSRKGNFYLEEYSDLREKIGKKTMGWFHFKKILKADFVDYMFLEDRILRRTNYGELKNFIYNKDGSRTIESKHFYSAGQGIYKKQKNVPSGILTPIDIIRKKVGFSLEKKI